MGRISRADAFWGIRNIADMPNSKTVVIAYNRNKLEVLGIFDAEEYAEDAILIGSTIGDVAVVTLDESKDCEGCYIDNPKINFLPYSEMDVVG